jgi:hypothetical protein
VRLGSAKHKTDITNTQIGHAFWCPGGSINGFGMDIARNNVAGEQGRALRTTFVRFRTNVVRNGFGMDITRNLKKISWKIESSQ